LFVHGRDISLQALLQTRESIEPSLAALAAQMRTGDDLKSLAECSKRLEDAFDDLPLFLEENVNWHMAVATASHNELMRAFMLSISSMIFKATSVESYTTKERRSQVLQAHSRIEAAIVAQDVDAARRRMARHLAAI